MKPPDDMITMALFEAKYSPCRSKRGVVCYVESSAIAEIRPEWRVGPTPGYNAGPVIIGMGHNGPPEPLTCPGREVCAGTCGRRSVHAEMRALRNRPPEGLKVELVHVELAADGGVVACDGPSCEQCSREILDVGFVAGVWLYEAPTQDELLDHERRFSGMAGWTTSPPDPPIGIWRRYTAEEFHTRTLRRCGLVP